MDNDPSLLPQWIEAIGTILAVVVALGTVLYFQLWLPRRNVPDLDIEPIKMAPPDCFKIAIRTRSIETKQEKIVDSYYLRFRVKNNGREKAENVEVFASKLTKLHQNGTYVEVPSFLPMHLTWSFYPAIFVPKIAPNMFRHCDIARIINPKDRLDCEGEAGHRPDVKPGETVLSFATIDKPHSLSYLQEHGTYRLTIVIAASNYPRPVEKCLEINLSKNWFDDEIKMLADSIGIKVL